MIERRLTDVAIGPLWDPVAVRGSAATPASSARLTLRIGGKCGPESGDPLDVTVEVRGVSDKLVQRGLGRPSVLGRAAWVEADGAHLILVERREQAFSPDLFTNMGLDLTAMRIAVVKSTAHFRAGFAPIAAEILTHDRPGPRCFEDFAAIPYQKRNLQLLAEGQGPIQRADHASLPLLGRDPDQRSEVRATQPKRPRQRRRSAP